MFDIITKEEYWGWIDSGASPRPEAARLPRATQAADRVRQAYIRWFERLRPRRLYELKDVQDAFVLSRLQGVRGAAILEVGGGDSRILPLLSSSNECWIVDGFEGRGRGPTRLPRIPGVRVVRAYMGDHSPEIPSDHFDFVTSVSVLEHVPLGALEAFFDDCARVLKVGGRMIHAIDTYLFDDADLSLASEFRERIRSYLRLGDQPDRGLRPVEKPRIEEQVRFSCRYATTPDSILHEWNRNRPSLKRALGQVVSIKAQWVKVAAAGGR